MVELAISYEGFDESLTLCVLSKEILAFHRAEAVESSTEYERLHTLAVAGGEVDTLDEIEDILIRSVFLSFLDDDICCCSTHTFDG